jgi:hypothetical protein
MAFRTPAHNLVVVDESEQRTQERGGSLHLFDVIPHVRVVDCSSSAYEQASLYRRMCVLVDYGAEGSYLIDLFSVAGGKTHDYLFHGPTSGFMTEGIALSPGDGPGPYGIQNLQRGRSSEPWRASWQMDEGVRFTAWAVPTEGEETLYRLSDPRRCPDQGRDPALHQAKRGRLRHRRGNDLGDARLRLSNR